jgi:prepilin-type N-terminal cleavage/methylation domain-containing protein/prepilin-type processing-associated H-X9-DG protein
MPQPVSPACRFTTVSRRRGFTLTELLVVIAILVLLSALMTPVFVQVRARARQSSCASNLAQIGRAGLLYLQDNDDYFPSCYQIPIPPYAIDPLTSLQPYLKNWALLYCPERHTIRDTCFDPMMGFRPGSRCMGYGYNWGSGLGWIGSDRKRDGLVVPDPEVDPAVRGVALAEVVVPAHCFFYGDTNDDAFITLLRDAMPGVRRNGDPNAQTNALGLPYEPPRHGGGNNFVFVDGHVRWLPFPGGLWIDGGPWVVPDMSMYSHTGQWEKQPVP